MRNPFACVLFLSLFLFWGGCSPRLVNPCDDQKGASGCVALQLDGNLGLISRLSVAERGAWVGSAEIDPGSAFSLPVAVAVSLPPFVSGNEFFQVTAYRDRDPAGSAEVQVTRLSAGEHLLLTLILSPTARPDGGARD